MNSEKPERDTEAGQAISEQFTGEAGVSGGVQPWQEIETGRFMPRRIKGSFKGRALG